MCLITVCPPNTRPDIAILKASMALNDDGSGIAWQSGGRVHWRKGLTTLEQVKDAIAAVPMEVWLVIHDRLATAGGEKAKLTHPFLIGGKPTPLAGSSRGRLLFHNGHYSGWTESLRAFSIAKGAPIPSGAWSDSRAIAYLTSVLGTSYLDLLPAQRFALLSATDVSLHGEGWTEESGVFFSNLSWRATSKAKGRDTLVAKDDPYLQYWNDRMAIERYPLD